MLTNTGEFVKVKKDKTAPSIGSIYQGKLITTSNWQKIITSAACLIFTLIISTEAYAYYIPTSIILLEGSLAAKIEINKWDRIISIEGTNKESEELLEVTSIKHTDIEDGLKKILQLNNKAEENLEIIIELDKDQNSDIEKKVQNILNNNKNNFPNENSANTTDNVTEKEQTTVDTKTQNNNSKENNQTKKPNDIEDNINLNKKESNQNSKLKSESKEETLPEMQQKTETKTNTKTQNNQNSIINNKENRIPSEKSDKNIKLK